MPSVTVSDIKIKHSGEFIVDTVPPKGIVSIDSGSHFTKSRSVSLSLNASDLTTGIKNVDVQNVNVLINSNGDETFDRLGFKTKKYEEDVFHTLPEIEGVKKVEVKFRDYAGNESEYVSNSSVRKVFSIDSKTVIDSVRILNKTYAATSDGGIYEL